MGIIISGFSGIGKSSLKEIKGINCIDLDTTFFKKIDGWVNIYIECVLALKDKYDYVLITTHGEVLHEMNKQNIDYTLVYPSEDLKEEYKNRSIKRGSPKDFIEGFFNSWDEHIHDCIKNPIKNKIVLNSNEYLSDVIDKIDK